MIEAVALDTNAFPKGRFNSKVLRSLAAQLARREIRLVIPEPVLWELADHLAQSWEGLRSELRSKGKELAQAGLEGPDELADLDAIEHLADELAGIPGLEVLTLDDDLALEALKDQVLVRGAGKRRTFSSGQKHIPVKLGAADSAIVRMLDQEFESDGTKYVIVSADSDLEDGYKALGYDTPAFYKSIYDLRKSVANLRPGPWQFVTAIHSFLSENVLDVRSDDPHDPVTFYEDLGETIGSTIRLATGGIDDAVVAQRDVELYSLSQVDAVGKVEVDIEEGFAVARCALRGRVRITHWVWDNDGRLVMGDSDEDEVEVYANLSFSFEWEPGGMLVILDMDNDEGVVQAQRLREDRHWDDHDLYADIAEWFEFAARVNMPEALPAIGEEWSHELEGGEVVEFSMRGPNLKEGESCDWAMEVSLGTRSWDVQAVSDDSAWVGGREGMWIDAPYIAVVDGHEAETVADVARHLMEAALAGQAT